MGKPYSIKQDDFFDAPAEDVFGVLTEPAMLVRRFLKEARIHGLASWGRFVRDFGVQPR